MELGWIAAARLEEVAGKARARHRAAGAGWKCLLRFLGGKTMVLPSGDVNIANWKITIEIVDFPGGDGNFQQLCLSNNGFIRTMFHQMNWSKRP